MSVFESLRWGRVVRVQVPINCAERTCGALQGLFYARWWGIRVRVTKKKSHHDKRRVPRDWGAMSRQKREQELHELAAAGKAMHRVISRVICIGIPPVFHFQEGANHLIAIYAATGLPFLPLSHLRWFLY